MCPSTSGSSSAELVVVSLGFFLEAPSHAPVPGPAAPRLKHTPGKKTKLQHHHVLPNPGLVSHTWEGPQQRARLQTGHVQWQVTPRREASSSPTPMKPAQARSWGVSSAPPHPVQRVFPRSILSSLSGVPPNKGYLLRLVQQHSEPAPLQQKIKLKKTIKK